MNQVNILLEPLRGLLLQLGAFMPRLALAVLILIAGWLLAKAASFTLIKALRTINFHVLAERSGLDDFLRQGGMQKDTTQLFGLLTYFVVILAALVIGFNSLGLTYVTDLLAKILLFVPKIIVSLLILLFGAYFSGFIGTTVTAHCRNLGMRDAGLIGRLAQYAMVAFVVLIALDQVNIGGDIVRQSFLVVLGGVVFALALAFGLGGREHAAYLLERWWPTRPPLNDSAPEPGVPLATPHSPPHSPSRSDSRSDSTSPNHREGQP